MRNQTFCGILIQGGMLRLAFSTAALPKMVRVSSCAQPPQSKRFAKSGDFSTREAFGLRVL
jgi:hypothetical protein